MKIEKIVIKKFRHMQDLEIKFGNNLTAISGQNSTGKSTILGMVGHIFDYKENEKTKNNRSFKAKYGDIFRFCPIHDKKDKHEYIATINDNDAVITKKAESRFVEGEGKTGRFRVDIGDRNIQGDIAISFPVIYLGLKRLYPLSQEREDSIKIKPLTLNSEEQKFYNKYAKEILILLDRSVSPQDIKSPNKEFLAMKTSRYGHLGNSAGQDNIGQILTAILSFRDLKNKKGDSYKGGLLLIDEVDATLYAGSQINLIEKLYKFSMDYSLQIIFTTHSLEVLNLLKEKTHWDTQINFLETKNSAIKNSLNLSIDCIRSRILVQTSQKSKIEKIHALCEDEVTGNWCRNLLNGTEVKQRVNVRKVPVSASTLKVLVEKKHPAFKKMIFVLDGDQKGTSNSHSSRLIFLPGKNTPEKTFYEFVCSLGDDDKLWDNEEGFTKQVCLNRYIEITNNNYKNWFEEKKVNFGRGCAKLFSRWKETNPNLVVEFQKDFEKALESIHSR